MRQMVLSPSAQSLWTCRRNGIRYSPHFLCVNVQRQKMQLYHWSLEERAYLFQKEFLVSTSSFGVGCQMNSYKTPLGLHRIASKIGGGTPQGTVFKARVPIGYTWKGMSEAKIAHRIFWLEGLESGKNKGPGLDSFERYIYIHGVGDETTLGRPSSCGCIHLAASDLMPLFDRCRGNDLVWIEER